jgi:hypothetical protein
MSAPIAKCTKQANSALSFGTNRSCVTRRAAHCGVHLGTGCSFVRPDARQGSIGPQHAEEVKILPPRFFFQSKPATSFPGVFTSTLRDASLCLHAHRYARLRTYCRRCGPLKIRFTTDKRLPAADQFLAQVRYRHVLHQTTSQNGNIFLSRVMLPLLRHARSPLSYRGTPSPFPAGRDTRSGR